MNQEHILPIAASITLFLLIMVGTGISSINEVKADQNDALYGYAWSSNIGWISFNCINNDSCDGSDYGVNVESNNDLSGYAWSSNIGWITFNPSELSGCPQGACKAKLVGGGLTGWARALAGVDGDGDGRDTPQEESEVDDDGWDGWISLGGSGYGITLNNNQFNGYAWGDDVVGWVDFNPGFAVGEDCTGVCLCDNPGNCNIAGQSSVDISANPTAVDSGENTTLTWVTESVDSCTASNGWSGSKSPTGGSEQQGPITSDTTFDITCDYDEGQVSDSVTVTLNPADFTIYKSNNVEIVFASGGATSTKTTITVGALNGFSENVSLSAEPSTISGVPATYVFYNQPLSSGEYLTGSEFEVYLSEPIPSGSYTITVKGLGGGLVRPRDVILNVDSSDIKFEEF